MNMPDFDIDDLLNAGADTDSDLVKQLRNALKAQKSELKTVKDELDKRFKDDRSRSLADVLQGRDLDPRIAKFYPGDADTSAEAVDAWLADNGELFGITNPSTTADAGTQQAAARVSNAASRAPAGTVTLDPSSLAAEMAAAKTPDELKAVLAKLA